MGNITKGRQDMSEPGRPSLQSIQMPSNGNVFKMMRDKKNIYSNLYSDTTNRWTAMVTLLCVWKQSVFKLIWNDLLIYLVIYFLMSIFYRNVLWHYPAYKQTFEMICIYADRFSSSIPITFLVGFWVSKVVNRWWDQFMALPMPDFIALKLVAFLPGTVSKLLYVSYYCFI